MDAIPFKYHCIGHQSAQALITFENTPILFSGGEDVRINWIGKRFTMFQDLSQRVPALEEMDREDIPKNALEGALKSLIRMNSVGNCAAIFWPELRKLLQQRTDANGPLRVLDVGCGAGDLTWRLEARAQREGYSLVVDGCDLSPVAISMATSLNEKQGAAGTFFVMDAVNDEIPEGYDVILSSLFFHHLDNEEGRIVLRKIADRAGTAVLLSDMIRSRLGLGLVYLATRTLSRSPVVHADGVTSLLAAYTTTEIVALAEELGLHGATLMRRWPERFLMTWQRA